MLYDRQNVELEALKVVFLFLLSSTHVRSLVSLSFRSKFHKVLILSSCRISFAEIITIAFATMDWIHFD